MTINELARIRKSVFQELKRIDRAIDSVQEAIQRKIASVLTRKRNVPENKDLAWLIEATKFLDQAVENLTDALTDAVDVFTAPSAPGVTVEGEQLSYTPNYFDQQWYDQILGKKPIGLAVGQMPSLMNIVFRGEKEREEFLRRNPHYREYQIGQ